MCIFTLLLFNFYAEYIMWNTRLVSSQVGIKIAIRNINNLRYADDITLVAKKKKMRGTKSLLMKVKKESGKVCLKLNIQKTKIMSSSPFNSWQMYGEMETVTDFLFLGSKISEDGAYIHEFKRYLLLEEKLWQT